MTLRSSSPPSSRARTTLRPRPTTAQTPYRQYPSFHLTMQQTCSSGKGTTTTKERKSPPLPPAVLPCSVKTMTHVHHLEHLLHRRRSQPQGAFSGTQTFEPLQTRRRCLRLYPSLCWGTPQLEWGSPRVALGRSPRMIMRRRQNFRASAGDLIPADRLPGLGLVSGSRQPPAPPLLARPAPSTRAGCHPPRS